ncbi:MAG: murein L,D-transpeptidase catalytic domain family protein [Bacteroidetes bacterium]|jgi:hypothetical protein|nr:MAG: murein L,D-transpeptidase catalytic domain family protein [Bacteroidota bacterium]
MRYPIRKSLLVTCLALACMAFTTSTISPNVQNKVTTVQSHISASPAASVVLPAPAPMPAAVTNAGQELYNDLDLAGHGMKEDVLESALKGFDKLSAEGKIANTEKLTIADFSQPSDQKRLYVIDLNKRQLIFQSLVSHGRGTGTLWAKSFSNSPSSYKSSPGFYVTEETYTGHNGYSLRLNGLERGINDNARNRAIVVHGAPYVSESAIHSLGFLGRSQGCPALPVSLHKSIINAIKNGTCFFIYTPDESYLNHSALIE